MKINRQFILASQSPRRRELLEMLGVEFMVDPSDFVELEALQSPEQTAIHNAEGKAGQVAKKHPDAIILGVDTVVYCRDQILGKPKDDRDAERILKLLSGSTHQVISALTLIDTKSQQKLTQTQSTSVTMDKLSPEQISFYLSSGEGKDKAAGYAIQGLGSLFITEIHGDYFNVVGLPIRLLYTMLQELGIKSI